MKTGLELSQLQTVYWSGLCSYLMYFKYVLVHYILFYIYSIYIFVSRVNLQCCIIISVVVTLLGAYIHSTTLLRRHNFHRVGTHIVY